MSRRATLGVLNDSAMNMRSTSTPKSRQSLGPGRQLSDGQPPLPMSKTSSSTMNRRQSNPRSSSAGMQRMTLTQQSSTRTRGITDPRNITDKRFITTSIGLLIEYLSQHGYDHFINPKILSSPSGKDFNNIVQFLFRQIDPNLTCPGKFEDEVIALFKFLRYPFNISKNGLSAVGSPHSWPQLLASLIWILELLEYDEEMMNTAENEEQQHASLLSSSALQVGAPTGGSTSAMESEDDQQNRQKLFYNYLKQAYKSFLNGDDDTYTALEQQYIESYQLKNQYFLDEIEKLNQINEQLDLEIQQVKSRRLKLPQLLEKKKDYLDDKNKFEILIEQLMKHKEMGEMKKQSRQQELEKLIQQIELTENEINFLKETISHQELSPEDVKRMSEEREHLQMSLNHSMEQLSQLQKKVWDQEVMLRDKVQNLEESVRLFNSMSEDLDYAITNAGTTPEKANLKKKIRIDLDTRAKTRNDLIQTNIRKDILPRLHRMKGVLSDTTVHLRGEIIIRQDALEELELENVKLTENKITIENKIKRSEDIYKKERMSNESNVMSSEQQIDELETRLMEIKNTAHEENAVTQFHRQIHEVKQTILLNREQHVNKKKEINDSILQSVTMLTEYKEKMKQRLGEIRELMEQKLQQTLSIEINEVNGVVVHEEIPLKKSVLHHQLLSSKKSKQFGNNSFYQQQQQQHGYSFERSTSPRLIHPRSTSPIEENINDMSLECGSLHEINESFDDRLQCEGNFEDSFLSS